MPTPSVMRPGSTDGLRELVAVMGLGDGSQGEGSQIEVESSVIDGILSSSWPVK